MYLYFDENGVLKEIVKEENVRQGDVASDKVYVYIEGITSISQLTGITAVLKYPNDTQTNEISFYGDSNFEEKQLPYSKEFNYKYFKDYTNYPFFVLTLGTNQLPLSQNGLCKLTIRAYNNTVVKAQGLVTFNVENSVIQDDYVITQSQYDYLMSLINSWVASINDKVSKEVIKEEQDGVLKFKTTLNRSVNGHEFALKNEMISNDVVRFVSSLFTNYDGSISLTSTSRTSDNSVVNESGVGVGSSTGNEGVTIYFTKIETLPNNNTIHNSYYAEITNTGLSVYNNANGTITDLFDITSTGVTYKGKRIDIINDNEIETAMIKDGAVTLAKLSQDLVNMIYNYVLPDGSVSYPKLDSGLKTKIDNIDKTGHSIELSLNQSDFKITAILKDKDGNVISTSTPIDLPLESVVVSGRYDSATKKVILTLQDGSTIDFSVADLVSGLQPQTYVLNVSGDSGNITDQTTLQTILANGNTNSIVVKRGNEYFYLYDKTTSALINYLKFRNIQYDKGTSTLIVSEVNVGIQRSSSDSTYIGSYLYSTYTQYNVFSLPISTSPTTLTTDDFNYIQLSAISCINYFASDGVYLLYYSNTIQDENNPNLVTYVFKSSIFEANNNLCQYVGRLNSVTKELTITTDTFSTIYNKTQVDSMLQGKVDKTSVVTTVSSTSTDNEVPSAKAVNDCITTMNSNITSAFIGVYQAINNNVLHVLHLSGTSGTLTADQYALLNDEFSIITRGGDNRHFIKQTEDNSEKVYVAFDVNETQNKVTMYEIVVNKSTLAWIYGTNVVDGGSTGEQWVNIWTNPSPTQTLGDTAITNLNMSQYKKIKIQYKDGKDYNILSESVYTLTGTFSSYGEHIFESVIGPVIRYRRVDIYDNRIVIMPAYYYGSTNEQNDDIIIVSISGVLA